MVVKAVFFGVDGVLLDTLPAHIQVCVYLAEKETLNLSIPTADEFKNEIIRGGREVAPMRCFFEAVGLASQRLLCRGHHIWGLRRRISFLPVTRNATAKQQRLRGSFSRRYVWLAVQGW